MPMFKGLRWRWSSMRARPPPSLLQRRCKLGYARAARIMDEMEQKGVIGPYEGAKPRAGADQPPAVA